MLSAACTGSLFVPLLRCELNWQTRMLCLFVNSIDYFSYAMQVSWPDDRLMAFNPGLWSRSRRLGLQTYQRLVSVSSREKLSTSRSRLGLGHLRLVPKTNIWPNCAGHSTQCERALDVVSLCCSYYCSSY